MTDTLDSATTPMNGLLPVGLQDQLPPDAEQEAVVLEGLMQFLGQQGFDRVKPPLLEFENTLLAEAPAKLKRRSFRVVDPLSQETLVLRSDITGQVIRMASTRLVNQSRPLRISYGGQVVRVSGSDLRPERQFTQVGAEIIGLSDKARIPALIQTAVLAVQGLNQSGINNVVLDLVLPQLIPTICKRFHHQITDGLLQAISARDPIMVAAHACDECLNMIASVMKAAGPWREALTKLSKLGDLLDQNTYNLIETIATALEDKAPPNTTITLDPAELRGFEYHDALGFVFFAPMVRGELGRGGLYRRNHSLGAGFTLYLDTVVRALGPKEKPDYVFVPTRYADVCTQLVSQGHRVRQQLEPGDDLKTMAAENDCTHYWDGQQVKALPKD